MDDDYNQDKSESTDENEERSETETECFDKTDSDIISQSENSLELRCIECNISFQNDFRKHKIHRHPIIMYKCGVDNCQRWFSSRKSRDKHSENLKSQLHKSFVKSPPVNAIFIENASQEELEILKAFSNENVRSKNKRGPRQRVSNETDFLIGLPRDQLKRKLMESVVEKMESNPNKKIQETSCSTKNNKKHSLSDQLSLPSDSKFSSNKVPIKSLECKNSFYMDSSQKLRSIPDLSHIKVPVLSLDSSYSIEKFSEELINLLVLCDPAEIFKYPLIDCFAPLSSRLTNQIDMKSIQRRLKEGMYSKNLEILENDLLLQYSNGIQSFDEKSTGWYESAKLYQTALVNIRIAKKIFDSSINDLILKNDKINSQVNADNISTVLNLINPYNNGKISDNERIMTIGDQIGKLKSGSYHLSGYKEDRRNKVTVLSYLDYGTNFSFGPSYDSGNSYCSKETSDLLIRAYGDRNNAEECQYGEFNEIIPEITLGDDFSIYLMNIFTKDIIKSLSFNEDDDKLISVKQYKELNGILNTNIEEMPSLQTLLDESWKDLARLKSFNYQRLSNYQLQPSCDEQSVSEKVTSNLINLIIKTNPESITNLKMIRKALNCK